MSGVVIPFAREKAAERMGAFGGPLMDLDRLAAALGTPDEWRVSAIAHLKAASCCPAPDGVLVSQAALHLVLHYLEALEGRLGIIAAPGGAA